MPLVPLLSPLRTPEEIAGWSFNHARDHDEIDAALLARGTVSPPTPLDPMPGEAGLGDWLLRHQTKHNDMNAALGLEGQDMTAFDLLTRDGLEGFAAQNFSEHDAVHQTLGNFA